MADQMERIPNGWKQLSYQDPEKVLRNYRELQRSGVLEGLPNNVKRLRTRELRPALEMRQAALFCYGMGQREGKKVLFSMVEERDHDFVAFYQDGDTQRYAPVQLKELVPPETNPGGAVPSLQDEMNKLNKYADAADLVIAMHISRNIVLDPAEFARPKGKLGALWLFGATDLTQRTWMLMGNLMQDNPGVFHFIHPEPV